MKVNLIVATHADYDHFGGIYYLLYVENLKFDEGYIMISEETAEDLATKPKNWRGFNSSQILHMERLDYENHAFRNYRQLGMPAKVERLCRFYKIVQMKYPEEEGGRILLLRKSHLSFVSDIPRNNQKNSNRSIITVIGNLSHGVDYYLFCGDNNPRELASIYEIIFGKQRKELREKNSRIKASGDATHRINSEQRSASMGTGDENDSAPEERPHISYRNKENATGIRAGPTTGTDDTATVDESPISSCPEKKATGSTTIPTTGVDGTAVVDEPYKSSRIKENATGNRTGPMTGTDDTAAAFEPQKFSGKKEIVTESRTRSTTGTDGTAVVDHPDKSSRNKENATRNRTGETTGSDGTAVVDDPDKISRNKKNATSNRTGPTTGTDDTAAVDEPHISST